MKKALLALCISFCCPALIHAQDTFSIVALDSITSEVGSAGALCVDLNAFSLPAGFLGELIPGVGAINTQASYLAANQANARQRMQAGDSPAQIISWLQLNDVQGNPLVRQYGIVGFVGNSTQSAAYTGTNTQNHKGHRTGPTYSIQGNILLGPQILDSMEYRFLNTSGTLADKLMAAIQGANVVGADTRCAGNGTSSLFAFLKVSGPTDPFGSPYLNLGVITANNAQIEPVDSLQVLYNNWLGITGMQPEAAAAAVSVWPNPARTELHISSSQTDLVSAEVFSVQGKRLISTFSVEKPSRLDISRLPAGLYIVCLTDKLGRRFNLKFVKE